MATKVNTAASAPASKPKPLSRLDDNKIRDPKYLVGYWKEHKDNFTGFLNRLLQKEVLLKLTGNAKSLTLQFLTAAKLMPEDIRNSLIKSAYDQLENLMIESSTPADLIIQGIEAYFSALEDMVTASNNLKFDQLSTQFASDANLQSKMQPWMTLLQKDNYNASQNCKFFYPQLIIFFARFFDIYDSSIKGEPFDSVLANIEKQQTQERVNEVKKDTTKLKNLWEKANATAPMGPAEPVNYVPFEEKEEDLEGSNPAIEEELVRLKDHEENSRLDMKALWGYKGKEFKEKWSTLSLEEKRKFIENSRENIKPTADTALMYCPEINVDDLSKEDGKPILDLMEQCDKQGSDINNLDDFTQKIAMQMKARNIKSKRTLMMIIYSRRYVFQIYCVNLMFEVLNLGEEQKDVKPTKLEDIAQQSINKKMPKPEPRVQEITSDDEEEDSDDDKGVKVTEIKETPKKAPVVVPTPKPPAPSRKCITCGKWETSDSKFSVCGSCKKIERAVPYCSRTCQQNDWPTHKTNCGKKQ